MDDLKKKTIISTLSLFFQSGYSAFLGLVANLVLTILLSPAIFGIYIATLSIISIFNYFSDIGMAASLIQKKEIDRNDERTVFTVQQLLIITLVIIGFTLTKSIQNFYRLPSQGILLYHALLIGFFLSSLKTLPSIILERKIQFQKIVLVQIIENTCFYLTVIILAILGWGLNSFSLAVIIRSIIGVITIYIISPWKPGVAFSFPSFKKLVSFGLPFQTTSLLALVKDDLITLYLGKVLGFQFLGYIGWAKKWAEAPIRIIMDNINRILFPLFSRLQREKQKLTRLVEKAIFYQSLFIVPATFGLVLTMDKFIQIIPKYLRWQPALPLFYLFCLSALFSSYSTPFINLLNGLGQVKISFYFMIFWTALTWILTPLLTKTYSLYGFPFTLIILSSTFLLVIQQAKKYLEFQVIKNVFPAFISSCLMVAATNLSFRLPFNLTLTLLVAILIGIITYGLTLLLIFKVNLFEEIKLLLNKNG
ncbi:hypothetical protein COS50_00910 [Candidatus Roizmanbacteria bacterium CG03_land_8_20_14_0_80_35_26]|uniref:Uncharacterized protein n=7 Tax=Candidatus Roizmaniibacteriota TaxID=1752723 RepID=A0A2M7BXN2_9BACT|nr:MAG: hypothetical protein COS50_00910 [Candidatus Roizmanbacteria bacterium CG03_land_8_20_14_0_80_35_26]PJC82391.1 MAG: hypothetical protein CO006_03865 [Candidatus Roizmanbacteria bacterium CG_4_8_14_3_um_filter_35_14]